MGEPQIYEAECKHCKTVYSTANPWMVQFCSDECRKERERERDRARRASPSYVEKDRERNRKWAEANRACATRKPWLAGAPPFDTYLPGASMAFSVYPSPKWPIELRNTRGLHGALTNILDMGHMPRFPLWTLFPYQSGWAVHWWHDAGASLAGKTVDCPLYGHPSKFKFGQAFRIKAPRGIARGRKRVRIDTITPVVMTTDGRTKSHEKPTSVALLNTLAGAWLQRFSLEHLKTDDMIRVEASEVDTRVARVEVGGKYGTVSGWEGHCVVEANAPARWLLEVAARTGFGGRTAFGFGRIRVSEVP
jgi:hypothetical protein